MIRCSSMPIAMFYFPLPLPGKLFPRVPIALLFGMGDTSASYSHVDPTLLASARDSLPGYGYLPIFSPREPKLIIHCVGRRPDSSLQRWKAKDFFRKIIRRSSLRGGNSTRETFLRGNPATLCQTRSFFGRNSLLSSSGFTVVSIWA